MQDVDEALALVDDGLLSLSAGFGGADGGDEWRGKHRRMRRAVLDHISLVPEPAYEHARITAQRSRSSTPNLDRIRRELLEVR